MPPSLAPIGGRDRSGEIPSLWVVSLPTSAATRAPSPAAVPIRPVMIVMSRWVMPSNRPAAR